MSAAAVQTASAVLVAVEIKPEGVDDFLEVMKADARGSRDKALEPNCLRFDLLRSSEKSNVFFFYEVFADDAAMAHHKTTDHYKGWAKFKETGNVLSQTAEKVESASIPGDFGLQANDAPSAKVTVGNVVVLETQESHLEKFLGLMRSAVPQARKQPGCLRVDLHRFRDNSNKFLLCEAFVNQEAAEHHRTTPCFKELSELEESGGVKRSDVRAFEADSFSEWGGFQTA